MRRHHLQMLLTQRFRKADLPQCPICLSSKGVLEILPCNHLIHLECTKGMTKCICPLCSVKMSTLPKQVKRQIQKNMKKWKEEIREEEHEAIVRRFEQEYNPLELLLRYYIAINRGESPSILLRY